jgi:hypothetical protein
LRQVGVDRAEEVGIEGRRDFGSAAKRWTPHANRIADKCRSTSPSPMLEADG